MGPSASSSPSPRARSLVARSPRPPRRPARNKRVRLPSLLEGNGCELASNGQLFFLHLHSTPPHLLFLALPKHAFAWSFGRCMGMMKKQAAPFPLLYEITKPMRWRLQCGRIVLMAFLLSNGLACP